MEQATATSVNDINVSKTFDRNLVNLESHQLVWLASKDIHNQVPIEILRKKVDYTKLFEDSEACAEYMNNSKEILTFMIISEKISEDILSCINNVSQVLGVYIHNINNEKYALNCGKVSIDIYSKSR